MELVEREELLSRLSALVGDTRSSGVLVFVGGEAGVGKTSLLRVFLEGLPGSVRVLWGSCDPLSTPSPLAPFHDMVALAALLARDTRRHELHTALLAELALHTVLVVEDAHWADEATLDALRFLGRRIEGSRSLVLVSYRDDEAVAGHPLRSVLGDLATASGCVRLKVPPLSPAGVARLAAGHAIEAERLHRVTGGNSFYVTEVLAAPGWTVPATVSDAVLARIARLRPQARDLLDIVSLAPGGLEPEIADRLLFNTARALDECAEHGVLVFADGLATFRHELARLAVEDAIQAGTKQALHRRLLETLEDTPGVDPARLAHHAAAAGAGPLVVRYASEAAERAAARGAHREAADNLATATRVAAPSTVTERAALHQRYAMECHAISRLDQSMDAWERAVALWREARAPLSVGECLARSVSAYVGAGRNADAERASKDAIDVLEALPQSAQLAVAYRAQAALRMFDRDCDEAIPLGERAIELAESFGDAETVVYGLNTIGAALILSDRVEEGCEYLARSMDMASSAGLDVHVSNGFGNTGSACGEVYRFDLADRALSDGVAYATEHDLDLALLYQLSWRALTKVYLGSWDEADEIARSVLERSQASISRIMALVALGRLRARRGEPGAGDALDEGLQLADQTGTLQRLGPVRGARAEAAWLEGDRERTLAEAQAGYALANEKRHAWFVGELAYWQWKAGCLDDVPTWAASPFVLQMLGDWSSAATAWRDRHCPYEEGRALAEGDERAMRKALEIFDGLGAVPAADQVRRRMRELGLRRVPAGPRASTRAAPAQLTRRQLTVLALLVEGSSNAEIAARLFIAEKTAAHHVSAILRKLGVRSRGEAAAAARKMGIAPTETG